MTRDPTPELLAEGPGPAALSYLRRAGFADPERAAHELRVLGSDPGARAVLGSLLPRLVGALCEAPDPDAALGRLERLARAARGPFALFPLLQSRGGDALRALSWALGAGSFAAEALVRHPEWLTWALDPATLAAPRSGQAIRTDVTRELAARAPDAAGDVLRRARRRELLAIALRDLLRRASVQQTLASLSQVANELLPLALAVAERETRERLGLRAGRGAGPAPGFCVLALGKLGASELNFSSDVDLVYLHRGDAGALSRGPGAPTRRAYLDLLARRLTAILGEATHEGLVFRVDLRLRPEGRAGGISHSLRSALDYYRTRGAAWERLALLKARPVAGDRRLAGQFLERVSPFVWGQPFTAEAVRQVVHMKQESDRRLAARGLSSRHVKLGRGGIRELELVAQVLQLHDAATGRSRPLRARGTLEVLETLGSSGILSPAEHGALERAYLFLRDVENKLQMVHDTQTHVLPADEGELRLLARRLGYQGREPGQALSSLRSDLASHADAVHLIFRERLLRPLEAESAR